MTGAPERPVAPVQPPQPVEVPPEVAGREAVTRWLEAQRSPLPLPERAAAFLDALAEERSTPRAWARSGLTAREYAELLEGSQAFRDAVQAIRDAWVIELEESALRRATHGSEEPVVSGGQVVGFRRRYETALTLAALKVLRPETWGAADGPAREERREESEDGPRVVALPPDVADALARGEDVPIEEA